MKIIYRGLRVGKNGKIFWMYKFKTLKEGTDKINQFAQENQYIGIGKFLRKYKLDELPQFFNVLKGDMSIVGPRPEEPETIELLPENIKKTLLSVKPGLTSFSSLYFFNEEEFLKEAKNPDFVYLNTIKPIKILLDIFYIKNHNLLWNLVILYTTFKKILKILYESIREKKI